MYIIPRYGIQLPNMELKHKTVNKKLAQLDSIIDWENPLIIGDYIFLADLQGQIFRVVYDAHTF